MSDQFDKVGQYVEDVKVNLNLNASQLPLFMGGQIDEEGKLTYTMVKRVNPNPIQRATILEIQNNLLNNFHRVESPHDKSLKNDMTVLPALPMKVCFNLILLRYEDTTLHKEYIGSHLIHSILDSHFNTMVIL